MSIRETKMHATPSFVSETQGKGKETCKKAVKCEVPTWSPRPIRSLDRGQMLPHGLGDDWIVSDDIGCLVGIGS